MALHELHSLLLIFPIAAVAPLLCKWVPRIRLPLVVLEITLGILIGPQVLGWAAAGPTIEILANFGLAFLFFLAALKLIFQPFAAGPSLRRPSAGLCHSLSVSAWGSASRVAASLMTSSPSITIRPAALAPLKQARAPGS
jgi:Kef-type K+ transport system membrane component KefB